MAFPTESKDLWSVILAGGEGERLRPLVQEWQGKPRPKQYCTFIGSRSMFQHTLDRADRLSPPERRVTILAESHRGEALAQWGQRQLGRVIFQPANRDTAAGVFLPLTYIRAQNPRATVVFYPSDHFVHPEGEFEKAVWAAVRTARLAPDQVVLLAVRPDRAEPEYGWIQPGLPAGWMGEYRICPVQAFREKPNATVARDLMSSGALWNTLILAAQVETLWTLGERCLPEMMTLLNQYMPAIGTRQEAAELKNLYRSMPKQNFSSDFLQRIPRQILAVEMNHVLWSDWGKPERIVDALNRIGKSPSFCLEGRCKWCRPAPAGVAANAGDLEAMEAVKQETSQLAFLGGAR